MHATKKRKKLQALMMSLILAFVIVGNVNTVSAQEIRPTTVESTSNDTLKILEIQPGNSYVLTSKESQFKEAFGVEHVTIEQMPVTLFNAERTELNGQYDVIYLGKGTNSKFTRSGNNNSGKKYTYSEKYGALDAPRGKIDSPRFYTHTNETEYEVFAPIDITLLKSGHVQEQANKGQMIILDSTLSSKSNTNIGKLADAIKDLENVVEVEQMNNEDIKKLGEQYKEQSTTKRPYLEVQEDGEQSPDTKQTQKRDLGFKITAYNYNSTDDTELSMDINLYIDTNGNGHFEEEEFVSRSSKIGVSNEQGEAGVGVNLAIPADYGGYLNYKIEVKDGTTGMSNYRTYTKYYTAPQPKVVKVLQIQPNSNNFDVKDDLRDLYSTGKDGLENYVLDITVKKVRDIEAEYRNDTSFNDLATAYTNIDKKYNLVNEGNKVYFANEKNQVYNIVDSLKKKGIYEEVLKEVTEVSRLNGEYDMIILGFNDNYEHLSNNALILDLLSFIETGQSVMFTHDSIGLAKSGVNKGDKGSNGEPFGKEFTLTMRELVGQGTYEPGATENRYNYVNYLINGMKIGQNNTGKVRKINEGQITSYPYDIQLETSVATTHHQWYKLNLEDPEIDVWYTLTGAIYNWYDPAQSYYTYSKGNITYSGTGHSTSYADKAGEKKMFINTIVKAANAANHAPIITTPDLVDGQMIDYDVAKEFTIHLDDIDLLDETASYEVFIYGESQKSSEDKPDGWIPEGAEKIASQQDAALGVDLKVALTEEAMRKVLSDSKGHIANGQDLTIVIKAKDIAGAESSKTVVVKAMKPFVNVSYSWDKEGYLFGDMSETTVNIEVPDKDKLTNVEVAISYKINNEETGPVIHTITKDNLDKDGNISFVCPQKIEGVTSNILEADITYTFEGTEYTDTYKGTIPSGNGKISIEVTGEHDAPLQDIIVNVTTPDGTMTPYPTPGSGILTLEDQISGTYKIQVLNQQDYLFDEAVKEVNLGYSKTNSEAYQRSIKYEANSDPIIIAEYTPKQLTMTAVDMMGRLDGTGSNIVEARYLRSDEYATDTLADVRTNGISLTLLDSLPVGLTWDVSSEYIPKDPMFVKWTTFPVSKNGWYTIYTKDEMGKEVIYKIQVDNIQSIDTLPDIT